MRSAQFFISTLHPRKRLSVKEISSRSPDCKAKEFLETSWENDLALFFITILPVKGSDVPDEGDEFTPCPICYLLCKILPLILKLQELHFDEFMAIKSVSNSVNKTVCHPISSNLHDWLQWMSQAFQVLLMRAFHARTLQAAQPAFYNSTEHRLKLLNSVARENKIIYVSNTNFHAQNQSSGCSSGGQPTHSVLMRGSIAEAKKGYSISPADLQG
jgi:hypothetical protein